MAGMFRWLPTGLSFLMLALAILPLCLRSQQQTCSIQPFSCLMKPIVATQVENSGTSISFSATSAPSLIDSKEKELVFALLANNRLIVVDVKSGEIIAQRSLGSSPLSPSTGHFLASSKDHKMIFVLPIGSSQVAVVDIATTKLLTTYSLNHGGFRSLAVGATTGRLYLFGNYEEKVVVTVLDPKDGRVLENWTARPPDGRDWWVYQGSVSNDERRLYISYHGSNTTGIDWFDISSNGLARCQSSSPANASCIASHGGFKPYNDGILASTGGSLILGVNNAGTIKYGFETNLTGNHLMEFAVNKQAGMLYAVGSCGFSGGFSVMDLKTGGTPLAILSGKRQWLATPQPPKVLIPPDSISAKNGAIVCGERLAVGQTQVLVIAKTRKPVPDPNYPGALLILDANTGKVLRTIATLSEPADVLMATSS